MVAIVDRSGMPLTEARVALFNGDLEDAVKKYSIPLEKMGVGLGNTVKFANYSPNPRYLLMVSQQIDKGVSHLQGVDYNCQLSVTSRDPELNAKLADRFTKESGIPFVNAPPKIAQFMQGIGLSFTIFEKYGPLAFEVLKKL